jgi:choline kinase
LVRVGKKPAISYIVEQYSPEIPIVVTLGHQGNLVKDFLEMAYPTRKFEFVTVDKYEGIGSSLLYSISKAKNNLQCPFIFHACDTITFSKIKEPKSNWIAGNTNGDCLSYRTFSVNKGVVTKLNEKGDTDFDLYYMGICGISNYDMFWNYVEEVIRENPSDTSLSDCHVIRYLIKSSEVTYSTFDSWLDIGNMKSLVHARENIPDKFHILDKDEESIFLFKDNVIKFFSDKKLCQNRVKRTQFLGGNVPRIISSKENYYQYEYANGSLLSDVANGNTIEKLINWSFNNLWKPTKCDNFLDICNDFYINKTEKRIKSFITDNNITDREEYINGEKTETLKSLMSKAKDILLSDCYPSGFHGDFILDNILTEDDRFILLDWRQDFGGNLESGDMYYDISKLNHNTVVNHDIVSKGLFEIKVMENNILCDIHRSHRLVECQEKLFCILANKGINTKKVKILTSVIWLNMAPLHEKNLGLFLYYFGKYNLNKHIKENL